MPAERIMVLIVEDNPGDARLVQEMLGELNGYSFDFKLADRLSSGLEFLSENEIDVVLLDLGLPDSSGFETFLRVHQHNSRVPVVLLTGYGDENLGIRAVREGAQDFLVKGDLTGTLLSRSIQYAIERKNTEEVLRESQERYLLAIQGANDGLWDWDLIGDVIYFSPRWKAMLGYDDSEINDCPEAWFSRIHLNDLHKVKLALSAHLDGLQPHFKCECRMYHKSGELRWMLVRGLVVRDEDGSPYRMAGSLTDITDRKNAEEKLIHNAFHDSLTGLPNRALFYDRLGRVIQRTKRNQDFLFAVLFLDLDRFKVINDSLGHAIGDQLLIQVAQMLNKSLRAGDTVARLGGDEFVILLEDINSEDDAIKIAERIEETFLIPFMLNNRCVYTSASIGIVMSSTAYKKCEEIMRDVDIAMYQAKLMGRSRHVVFNKSMRSQAFARLEMEDELRQAIDRDELRLFYQPIISLDDRRVIGFEALLRWNHMLKGDIPPKVFIPIAEETGLIYNLGSWVIREACLQLRKWQDQYPADPPLQMNVNLSAKQFDQPELADQILAVLEETGVDPKSLNIELTENMLLGDVGYVQDLLNRLRDIGIMIHIDDFGTGYSSFSYLQRFPINALKIDQTFIQHMGINGDQAEIVKTILVLAKELDMKVIAEGVETKNQFESLKALDCAYGQGLFMSGAIAPEMAAHLLESQAARTRLQSPWIAFKEDHPEASTGRIE